MELFSADTTIFKKEKKCPPAKKKQYKNYQSSRLNWAVLSITNLPKTSPDLKFCSMEIAHLATYM